MPGYDDLLLQTSDFVLGVGAQGDGLAEMSGELACTVVSYCNDHRFLPV